MTRRQPGDGARYSYLLNGNLTSWLVEATAVTRSYDVDHRLTRTSATTERYEYHAANRRVQVAVGTTWWTPLYFYGLNGELLSSSVNPWPGTGLVYPVLLANGLQWQVNANCCDFFGGRLRE